MPVGMLPVGFAVGVAGRIEHHEIRTQIRQGMDAVGDQRLGVCQCADHDLGDAEGEIEHRTHQGDIARGAIAFVARVLFRGQHRGMVMMVSHAQPPTSMVRRISSRPSSMASTL